ncbi:hypothetical protein [Fuchsiella alkaliacetigena]|uniref:hypothetical protein n=1 Tax=Fuchsiella alkaliacetigena TaxID=957042 RepID=UPI00200B91AD|nr:hypothetical protein [Fuchsiella alkaliacetigena]MCK8823636.1 hypothetical protein [Fuchsiella alkaliacetigena]
MSKNKLLRISVLCLVLLLAVTVGVQAHRMIVEEPEDGQVKARFDDGSVAVGADVSLYDIQDELILEGETNEDGIFEFEAELEPHRVVAQDDAGHRAVWESGAEPSALDALPMWVRAALGIGILIILGALTTFFKSGSN